VAESIIPHPVRRGKRVFVHDALSLGRLAKSLLVCERTAFPHPAGFANGRVSDTKTRLSTHAVPLQSIALDALDRLTGIAEPDSVAELPGRPHRLPKLRPTPKDGALRSDPNSRNVES
jgi:hypothetical protein